MLQLQLARVTVVGIAMLYNNLFCLWLWDEEKNNTYKGFWMEMFHNICMYVCTKRKRIMILPNTL